MALAALLRNVAAAKPDTIWRAADAAGLDRLVSPCEAERFARHAVSHWNPYGRRIKHFVILFVFKGLSSFWFRRFHGAPVSNN
jgi:hypothetical protein